MTAFTLKLKNRDNDPMVRLPRDQMLAMVTLGEEKAKEALWQLFKDIDDGKVNDKAWLVQIVNWMPKKGLALTEMSKWLKIAKRVNDLKDEKEGNFSLSQWHVDLIWSRLTDPDFKWFGAVPPAFVEFLTDFMAVTGKCFENEEPDEVEEA